MLSALLRNPDMPAAPLLALACLVSAAPPDPFPPRTVARWAPALEWEVAAEVDGNPFDVEATATFTHADTGATHAATLFYDPDPDGGGGVYKFRFTGTEPGESSFETAGDPALAGRAGAVTVTERPAADGPDPLGRGFLTHFGPQWGWSGTGEAVAPQFVMAKSPRSYLTRDGRVDADAVGADVREFIDGHGFTGFHIPCDGSWFDGENPDPRVYRALEALIVAVHARGGACHLWLWGSGSADDGGRGPVGLAGGFLSEKDRRNLRYLAARLGPLPGWSLGYGFDTENGWASPEQLDEWKAYVEARTGWDHLLGARVGADEKGLFALDPRPPRPPSDAGNRAPVADEYVFWHGGDYTGYTGYRPLYPRYAAVMLHRPEKPSFEEDRFRLRDSDQWSYKDYSADLTRRGLWHALMAGGVANIWGNLLPSDDDGGSRPYPPEAKAQIKTHARFWDRRFLRGMRGEYVGPELRLSIPDGSRAVIYREDTDRVRFNAPNGAPVVAVDARRPYEELRLTDLAPGPDGSATWRAPRVSDWAVAAGDFDRPPDPNAEPAAKPKKKRRSGGS